MGEREGGWEREREGGRVGEREGGRERGIMSRAETNTCTIRLFDRFDSIRMLLQLFEYSFEVF